MRRKFGPLTILEYICLVLLAVLFIFPLFWMIASSMKPEAEVYNNMNSIKAFLPSFHASDWFTSYKQVLSRFHLLGYIINSLFYGLCVAAGSVIINGMAGYAFAKLNFNGKRVLFGLLLALLIVPLETILISQFTIVHKLGLVDTRLAVILPALAGAFNIYLFRNFFMAIPSEIIESAKLDGANTWQIFLRIMLPMSKPAVATVGTLAFIGSWNDYIWPLMVLTDKSKFPIQVAITAINSTEPVYTNQVMAVLTISTIPLILIYIVAQRYILEGIGGSGTGIK
ncbi:carbohydrate ABC transporter permease [Priestia megaterium]|uniref:carbohydrate ABC transporter permease n=1 Tax=Priestia TaxID=2800373 RepID=UPI000BEC8F1B|nr:MULTISPECIES: carbohydrate ABC transporter permease [Priestia]MCU7746670.1 carbohydrate ABC transporter permease [Priestia megaterium]MCU7766350.1 carbohydrate ABC transporter permease [Priestia megaterium]MDP9726434.1 fructooligosaccharide transport system permease protein [Priestia aryabhattai]MDW4512148.1 carbohydrate ABC transporter permease [Priestia megaterium]MED3855437.1 carbohydrate ABC transporter permease [Priestia megaterium]